MNRNFHIILSFVVLSLFVSQLQLRSQQLPAYSQYLFNKFLLNPAAAGSDGYTSVGVVAREQWVGFEGAPKTHALVIDSRLLRNSYIEKEISVRRKDRMSSRSGRIGWAAHVFNDHTEVLSRTGVEGTYAYHITLDQAQVSFGLSGIFYQFKWNNDQIILSDNEYDPLLDGGNGTMYIPDANFGVYYTSAKLHGGVSVMHLLQSAVQFGDKNKSEYSLKRTYNMMGGYLFEINDNFALEPSLLLKIPTASKAQLDMNVRLLLKETYWAGLSYRTGNTFIMYLGARIDRYFIGYAFDYNFNSLMDYTYGTHEFMATVKFGENARRFRWVNAY